MKKGIVCLPSRLRVLQCAKLRIERARMKMKESEVKGIRNILILFVVDLNE